MYLGATSTTSASKPDSAIRLSTVYNRDLKNSAIYGERREGLNVKMRLVSGHSHLYITVSGQREVFHFMGIFQIWYRVCRGDLLECDQEEEEFIKVE